MPPSTLANSTTRQILVLVLAGESIFILPFVLPRVFRSTVLTVYGIDNTQLGVCFAVYGFVALGAYLFGGPVADRFRPARLMATALWLTAAGGLVAAAAPHPTTLQYLYGYWGFTTIFLFWAAMIKATRAWGGAEWQGRAFGFLDGGRGLVGALIGLLGVLVFERWLGGVGGSTAAYNMVLLVSSTVVALVGVLVWFGLDVPRAAPTRGFVGRDLARVLRLPSVWLLMVIIVCAYTGYRATDILSLYAREVMGFGEAGAARTGTALLFMRPLVGVGVGLLADRSRPSRYLIASFVCTLLGSLVFAAGGLGAGQLTLFWLATVFVALGVYAGRVLYFAVLEEGRIPLALTGTAVGVISFVGYTPDIFSGLVFGYFLDNFAVPMGYRYVFWFLAGMSVVGLVGAVGFWAIGRGRGCRGEDGGAVLG